MPTRRVGWEPDRFAALHTKETNLAEHVKMGEITISAETTLVEAQAQAIKAYAEREAIVIGDDRVTFRELGDFIDRLAAGLYKLGLQKGDVVILFLPTCLEFVYLYWALGKVGAVVAPVNPLSRQAEIAHILADSEAKAVVFEPNVSGNNLMAIMRNVRGDLPHLSHLIVRGDDVPEGMIAFDSLMTSNRPRPPDGINEPDDLWELVDAVLRKPVAPHQLLSWVNKLLMEKSSSLKDR